MVKSILIFVLLFAHVATAHLIEQPKNVQQRPVETTQSLIDDLRSPALATRDHARKRLEKLGLGSEREGVLSALRKAESSNFDLEFMHRVRAILGKLVPPDVTWTDILKETGKNIVNSTTAKNLGSIADEIHRNIKKEDWKSLRRAFATAQGIEAALREISQERADLNPDDPRDAEKLAALRAEEASFSPKEEEIRKAFSDAYSHAIKTAFGDVVNTVGIYEFKDKKGTRYELRIVGLKGRFVLSHENQETQPRIYPLQRFVKQIESASPRRAWPTGFNAKRSDSFNAPISLVGHALYADYYHVNVARSVNPLQPVADYLARYNRRFRENLGRLVRDLNDSFDGIDTRIPRQATVGEYGR